MARGLIDSRRFILTEIMHTDGVELHCLDCGAFSSENPVRAWEHNSARLDEVIVTAEEHEEKKH